jgi:hypothetical protein
MRLAEYEIAKTDRWFVGSLALVWLNVAICVVGYVAGRRRITAAAAAAAGLPAGPRKRSRGTLLLILIIGLSLGCGFLIAGARNEWSMRWLLPLLWAPPLIVAALSVWFLRWRGKVLLGLGLLLGGGSAVVAGMGGAVLEQAHRAESAYYRADPYFIISMGLIGLNAVLCIIAWFVRRPVLPPIVVAPAEAAPVAPGVVP